MHATKSSNLLTGTASLPGSGTNIMWFERHHSSVWDLRMVKGKKYVQFGAEAIHISTARNSRPHTYPCMPRSIATGQFVCPSFQGLEGQYRLHDAPLSKQRPWHCKDRTVGTLPTSHETCYHESQNRDRAPMYFIKRNAPSATFSSRCLATRFQSLHQISSTIYNYGQASR